MRGFLGGVSLGAVLAIIGAGALSLMTPLPQRPDVVVDAPERTAEPSQGDNTVPSGAGADADLVDAEPTAPEPAKAPSGDLSALEQADTEPAAQPVVGGATGGLNAPQEGEAAGATGASDEPVNAARPTDAPAVPSGDAAVIAETESSQPQTPAVEDTNAALESPDADASPSASLPDAEESSPDVSAGEEPSAPSVATAPVAEAESTPQPAESATPAAQAPLEEDAPATQNVSEADTATKTEQPSATPAPTEAPRAPVAPDAGEEDSPRIAALPQAGGDDAGESTRPGVGTPVVPLTERDNSAPDTGSDASGTDPGLPPIEAFAAPFVNEEGKPLLSIVLMDEPDAVGAEALLEFPYPLTFALDPEDPEAAQKMTMYRNAGFEVVLLANLPDGSTAVDVETALEVWFNSLPETVALLEGTGSGIQGNRELSDQVTAVVKASGRGLVTQDRGLNTVQKLAARDGVPSDVVFRDFDGAGQTPTVMRRFLDQAAFRAGQLGGVIMLGRVQPDTISALLLWGLQDRASRVALAPLSVTLQRAPQ